MVWSSSTNWLDSAIRKNIHNNLIFDSLRKLTTLKKHFDWDSNSDLTSTDMRILDGKFTPDSIAEIIELVSILEPDEVVKIEQNMMPFALFLSKWPTSKDIPENMMSWLEKMGVAIATRKEELKIETRDIKWIIEVAKRELDALV